MSNTYVKIGFDRAAGFSELSVFIEIDGDKYQLPRSQISEHSGFEAGETEKYVVIPEWLANDRDLTDYAEEY